MPHGTMRCSRGSGSKAFEVGAGRLGRRTLTKAQCVSGKPHWTSQPTICKLRDSPRGTLKVDWLPRLHRKVTKIKSHWLHLIVLAPTGTTKAWTPAGLPGSHSDSMLYSFICPPHPECLSSGSSNPFRRPTGHMYAIKRATRVPSELPIFALALTHLLTDTFWSIT